MHNIHVLVTTVPAGQQYQQGSRPRGKSSVHRCGQTLGLVNTWEADPGSSQVWVMRKKPRTTGMNFQSPCPPFPLPPSRQGLASLNEERTPFPYPSQAPNLEQLQSFEDHAADTPIQSHTVSAGRFPGGTRPHSKLINLERAAVLGGGTERGLPIALTLWRMTLSQRLRGPGWAAPLPVLTAQRLCQAPRNENLCSP